MLSRIFAVLFLSASAFQSAAIHLQDTAIIIKQEVIVTAQRMETRATDVSDAVVWLDRDPLLRLAPVTTPDAMSALAGVWMQKTNLGGGSPFIRGLTGYHTLLLTDGIRFNNSTFRSGPNQYLNTIDPLTLQRIEVLRGQGSVQYGSDGIGGVAQLFFREPELSPDKFAAAGRLYAQYMNHDMQYAGRTEIELGSENLAFLGGIGYKQLGDIKAGGDLGVLKPTGYDEYAWDIKTKARLGSIMLTAAWQHLRQEDVPLYHQLVSSYTRYHFNPQQRDLGYMRLESFHRSKFLSRIRYTVAYLNSLEEREKQRTGSSILRYERDNVDTWHSGLEVISDFSPQWKASSGIEFYHDKVESSARDENQDTNEISSARGLYPDGTTYSNFAVYMMHTVELKRFNISMGGRYNFIQLNVNDPAFGPTVVKPHALVGNLGTVFNASRAIQLLASANTGFRSPNVNDVSSFGVADYRYEVPNYELKPEKSFQYQAGLRSQLRKWRMEIYIYKNHLSHLISNVPSTYNGQDSLDGFKVYKKENVNKAVMRGVEGEIAYQPTTWLSTFANITYTVGDNETRNEPLSRIPPLFGRIGIDLKFRSAFTWRIEFITAASQDRLSSGDKSDSRIKQGGTPGWNVVNTRLEYTCRILKVNTGVQNIFDTAYRVHGSGVDGVGRSFWISVMVELSSFSRPAPH